MIAGIDFGRGATKVSHAGGTLQIPNLIAEGRDRNYVHNKHGIQPINNLDITLEGKRYFVGQLAKDAWNATQTFQKTLVHEHTSLMLLAALSLLPDEEFDIVVGLPIADFRTQKKDLAGFLRGRYRYSVGDTNRQLFVRSVSVFPQGVGALYGKYLDWSGNFIEAIPPRVAVVDVGYKDCNFAYLENAEFVDRLSWSYPIGLHTAFLSAIQDLGGDVTMSEITPEDVAPHHYERLRERIQNEINQFWKRRGFPIYSIGGGSYWVKIGEMLPEPEYANAVGFRKLGVMRYA